jgi:N-methylhydantoinase A
MTDPIDELVVGVDIGGTFTDVVLQDAGGIVRKVLKVPSTPSDQSVGFMNGLNRLGVAPEAVVNIVHATTVATNAVIERKGGRCLLVTTRGFRDLLELGRRDRPSVYGLSGYARPLVPRRWRIEVDERTRHNGQVVTAVEEKKLHEAVAPHIDHVDCVVVSFLNSYANSENEDRVCSWIRSWWPERYTIGSSEALRKMSEFERTSTAVVHAYVQPVLSGYFSSLARSVASAGYATPPVIVQSNGGIMTIERALARPANTVRSGPAAGAIAAASVARLAGYGNAITADIGGTSFDVALIVDGAPSTTEQKMLDFRVPLTIPTIDVETLGAGGGSLARIDSSGILRVGPESAGADPGPACYGKSEVPTVTDANLLLGRINPGRSIAGEFLQLDADASARAVETDIARPLGMSLEEAAEAILQVVDSRMASQARLMSIGRGFDPRDFVLVPFGGGGPLHGAALMREVGIPRALIPPLPGVLSALGCVEADVQNDYVYGVHEPIAETNLAALNTTLGEFIEEGRAFVEKGHVRVANVEILLTGEMLFAGQRHSLRVPLGYPLSVDSAREAFLREYGRAFGDPLNTAIVLVDVTCRVVGRRLRNEGAKSDVVLRDWDEATLASRMVYFEGSALETQVLRRDALVPGMAGSGPAVIEQEDTTILVPPRMSVVSDSAGNLLMESQS